MAIFYDCLDFILLGRSIWTLLLALVLAWLIHWIGIMVYNAFFHLLSKFPGPLLFSTSMIPIYYIRLRGRGPQCVTALHNRYGSVVRLGPNELSYINPRAWKDIYGHRTADKPCLKKDLAFYGPDASGVPGMMRSIDDANHSRQRRIFSPAFSEQALRQQEPLIRKYVDLFIKVLNERIKLRKENPGDPRYQIDIVKLYNCTTFDIMGDLTFGEPLGLLSGGEYNSWVAGIFGMIKSISFLHAIRRFPILNLWFERLLPKSVREERKLHFQFSKDRVDRRMAQNLYRPDIWSLVIQNEEPQNIVRGEMYSNSSTFMMAGTEKTATLLSGLTYLLCKNPDKYKKLVDEIRVFKSPDEIRLATVQKLKYLQVCLEEALRVYPPFPGGAMRLTPPEGAAICGQWVPGGVIVSLNQLAAYHLSSHFADPLKFEPERWTSERDPKYENDVKSVLQPFSSGPRNCLGKNLAYHEMRTILVTLLWYFDISLENESEPWMDQKIYELWDKTPLHVILTPIKR